jgi:hypothetical protein
MFILFFYRAPPPSGITATRAMLIVQPRHYSTWNIRKRMIMNSSIGLEEDLHFSSVVLQTHPKKHECWSHRLWIFERALKNSENRDELLRRELKLCGILAEKAPRNFYAWQHCHRVSAEIVRSSEPRSESMQVVHPLAFPICFKNGSS